MDDIEDKETKANKKELHNINYFSEVYKSYKNIKEQEYLSEINNKLIKMLDDVLKIPFEILRKNDLLSKEDEDYDES